MTILVLVDQLYTTADSALLVLVVGGAAGLLVLQLSSWIARKIKR